MSANAETVEQTKEELNIAKPNKWAVILHNDDVTPMPFVINLLCEIFNYKYDDAQTLTMVIHESSKGQAGVYHYEIAEQKFNEALLFIAVNGYQLKVTLEEMHGD